MPISALRHHIERSLLAFAWDEWSQMGVFSKARMASPWAQDPEALLLFTLEVARLDPRLFDEVLDWMVVNEPLLSVRRLRGMAVDEHDARLAAAALAWLGSHRPRSRLSTESDVRDGDALEPLFFDDPVWGDDLDPAFAEHGFARSTVHPSGKASEPQLEAPINLGFRLRHLLGVGARAEVMRFLLTVDAPWATSQVVANSAGYSKRNVYEALTSLHSAGVVTLWTVGVEQRYGVDPDRWARLLDIAPGAWPIQRDWPQLLGPLRLILRRLRELEHRDLSEYLLASEIRELLDEVRPMFGYAGVHVASSAGAASAVDDLGATLQWALGVLGGVGLAEWPGDDGADDLGTLRFMVYVDSHKHFRWALRTADGEMVATSSGSFRSAANARRAANLLARTAGIGTVRRRASDEWAWDLQASNGERLATSAGSFPTADAARKAVRPVLDRLPDALEPSDVGEDGFFGEQPVRRTVRPDPQGGWAIVEPGPAPATAVAGTQAEAVNLAREIIRNAGGGELTIRGRDGRIREQNTVPGPAGDPHPPRARKR
jgi:uncharacterized protein YegP (UPF0339 family)